MSVQAEVQHVNAVLYRDGLYCVFHDGAHVVLTYGEGAFQRPLLKCLLGGELRVEAFDVLHLLPLDVLEAFVRCVRKEAP